MITNKPTKIGETMTNTMKTAAIKQWGNAEEFEILQLPIPELEADDVLIKVAYAGLNPADWKMRAGYLDSAFPGATFPFVPGLDASGTVLATGEGITEYSIGDRVVSGNNIFHSAKPGAYAQYLVVNKQRVASVPEAITLESASTLPTAGVTAWQAIFAADKGNLTKGKGKKILINGASGGIGSFAVQLAKWAGAEVATTCSGSNLDYVKSLGSDLLIDYKTQNISEEIVKWAPQGTDLIIDAIGPASLPDSLDLLKQGGRLISIATLTVDGEIEADIAEAEERGFKKIYAMLDDTELGNTLQKIIALVSTGKMKLPPVENFELDDVIQAHKKLESGHVRGKLALRIAGE